MSRLELPATPNAVFASSESAIRAPRRHLELCFDEVDRFVFDRANTSVTYEPSLYQNDQSHSATFRDHMLEVAERIRDQVGTSARVCEIGCGKGAFLSTLTDLGFSSIVGFDAAYEGDDPRVNKRYLGAGDAPLGADVVVLRHVLEHVPNPRSFVSNVIKVNGSVPLMCVEVPSLDWIREQRTLWDLTPEHVNYFDQKSIGRVLRSSDVSVHFGGQYLLAFSQSSLNDASPSTAGSSAHSEIVDPLREGFLSALDRLSGKVKDGRWWIWGAATKGALVDFHVRKLVPHLSNTLQGLVDISPAKQGRFIGCTGTPVISPAQFKERACDGDVVWVSNPQYVLEIRDEIDRLDLSCRLFCPEHF